MSDKIQIFIDGGNFYHLTLKKMGLTETEFDFEAFAEHIAGDRQIVDSGKRYYVGTVREREGDPHSKNNMARQTTLFSSLIKNQWQLKTSKLREREEKLSIDSRVQDHESIRKLGIHEVRYTKNREKGIDVKLVVDLFIGALDDRYDTAVIISSDTDLVPAIDSIRMRFKKKIEYVGFSIEDPRDRKNDTKPTLSMISKTDIQRTFIESDLRAFVIPNLFTPKK
ncbi:MAG: NYN domain-containing protein [Patescibacteria group bacterium]